MALIVLNKKNSAKDDFSNRPVEIENRNSRNELVNLPNITPPKHPEPIDLKRFPHLSNPQII